MLCRPLLPRPASWNVDFSLRNIHFEYFVLLLIQKISLSIILSLCRWIITKKEFSHSFSSSSGSDAWIDEISLSMNWMWFSVRLHSLPNSRRRSILIRNLPIHQEISVPSIQFASNRRPSAFEFICPRKNRATSFHCSSRPPDWMSHEPIRRIIRSSTTPSYSTVQHEWNDMTLSPICCLSYLSPRRAKLPFIFVLATLTDLCLVRLGLSQGRSIDNIVLILAPTCSPRTKSCCTWEAASVSCLFLRTPPVTTASVGKVLLGREESPIVDRPRSPRAGILRRHPCRLTLRRSSYGTRNSTKRH